MELQINQAYYISDIGLPDKFAYLEHLQEKQIYDQTLAIPFPYTEADADWWINHNLDAYRNQSGRSVNWAIRRTEDNYLIGGIGFLDFKIGESHKAEIGYWLAKPYWNKGVMTATVKKVIEYGFKEFGLTRITASVFHFNAGSARVLEKAGFQCEGYLRSNYKKDGKIFDSKLYAILKDDRTKTNSRVTTFALNGMIRLAKPEDAKSILNIYSPYIERTPITFETTLPSVSDIQKRIVENAKLGFLVYEIDGQVVGYAYASKHRERAAYKWCCEVSAYVSESFQTKGVASALYSNLFCQLKGLGYVNAYAGITLPNEKSVRFHESMGFQRIGIYKNIGFKLGKWHDVGWWGLQLQELPSHPSRSAINPETDVP